MVGLTTYMRCSECRRINTLNGIKRRTSCTCGSREFWNASPTILERLWALVWRR